MSRETVKKLLIIATILLIVVASIFLVDINQVIRNEEPRFIFNTKTYDYNNLVITEYTGFGYKIINYDSIKEGKSIKFGTIFLSK